MIQAFVSLKPQQPPRTESGMRSFFEALQGAVLVNPRYSGQTLTNRLVLILWMRSAKQRSIRVVNSSC